MANTHYKLPSRYLVIQIATAHTYYRQHRTVCDRREQGVLKYISVRIVLLSAFMIAQNLCDRSGDKVRRLKTKTEDEGRDPEMDEDR
jgi:hypothetical protein